MTRRDDGSESNFIKTEEQIKTIGKNLELNAAVYKALKDNIRPGVTELEIYDLIENEYYRRAGKKIEFVSDVIAGENTSHVSGAPTEYNVKKEDTIIIDILPYSGGLYCDTTRTFFVGEPDGEKKKIYSVLCEALEQAQKKIAPGIAAKEVYAEVHETLKKYGMHGYFPHHAGHGFGKTIFEEPYFLPDCETILKENMVVAVEPGVYLEGKYGIRIENNYRITSNGCEELGVIPIGIDDFIIAE